MAKKRKLTTPDWIIEGYENPAEYAKAKQKAEPLASSSKSQTKGKSVPDKKEGKTFKIKVCPKCGSDEVAVTLSNLNSEEESNTGKQWECRKCKWIGGNIKEKELTEDELMAHLDKKGEEVA